jgi:hypothetical protein
MERAGTRRSTTTYRRAGAPGGLPPVGRCGTRTRRGAALVAVGLLAALLSVIPPGGRGEEGGRLESTAAPQARVLGRVFTRVAEASEETAVGGPATAPTATVDAAIPSAATPSPAIAPPAAGTIAAAPAHEAARPAPTAPVVPSGPVTNTAVMAEARLFVNQSTSFVSSAGTLSSRRPQRTERASTSLFDPQVSGLPDGVEWRVLWMRAHNCETGARGIEFFVVDEARAVTVRAFVQHDSWTPGEPARVVAVAVPAGGQLSWTESAAAPLIVGPGESLGARWYGMVGGSEACNWQFAAIQQPAGTGDSGLAPSGTSTVGGSFRPTRSGSRADWQTVPSGSYWVARTVSAQNCEDGTREMQAVLLGPGGITMGVLTPSGDGAGPVAVPAGGTFSWSAPPGSQVVLPPGWSVGVRWLGLTADDPGAECAWSATVSVGEPGS